MHKHHYNRHWSLIRAATHRACASPPAHRTALLRAETSPCRGRSKCNDETFESAKAAIREQNIATGERSVEASEDGKKGGLSLAGAGGDNNGKTWTAGNGGGSDRSARNKAGLDDAAHSEPARWEWTHSLYSENGLDICNMHGMV